MPLISDIKNDAFRNTDLSYINFQKVTNIERFAFYNCQNLNTVITPSLEIINTSVFEHCTSLRTIDMPLIRNIKNNGFLNTDLSYINLPKLIKTEGFSFYDCKNLNTVITPSLKIIGHDTFGFCIKLKSIELSDINRIGQYVFNNCQSLNSFIYKNKTYKYLNDLSKDLSNKMLFII